MQKYLVLLGICLIFANLVAARHHLHLHSGQYRRKADAALPLENVRYSPELMRELLDFRNLIPRTTIDELVAKHTLIDGGFRKAVIFLKSSEFTRLQHSAEQLPEVIKLINFLHMNGDSRSRQRRNTKFHSYDDWISDVETLIVLLDSRNDNNLEHLNPPKLGSFTSFVQELLTHLPRESFVELIKTKLKKSPIFASFYKALRSAEFKPLVEETMLSPKVAAIIRTLNSHKIDVQSLKTIGYEALSWGPEPNEQDD
ncbi:uncharacterized protein LOC115625138 [Scaptodrosophila lebanonensis]|uniref:Uncharacterized protein LOC115625138 n=1 Tax=Drosophila lebanonensis TaxID=7225 RepID=A0A6J2TKC8_DROLE|nr:uncharacterized protein LOC115625138 [Scaptodrosophila lebanonensis]